MLDYEVRVANQITSGSNLGSHATPASLWSSSTAGTSDPFGDIQTAKSAIRSTTGLEANTIIFGREVYDALTKHADIIDRIKYVQKGVVTADILASLFDVDRVLVGNAIKNTGSEGLADSFADVWGKNTVLAHLTNGVDADGRSTAPGHVGSI